MKVRDPSFYRVARKPKVDHTTVDTDPMDQTIDILIGDKFLTFSQRCGKVFPYIVNGLRQMERIEGGRADEFGS